VAVSPVTEALAVSVGTGVVVGESSGSAVELPLELEEVAVLVEPGAVAPSVLPGPAVAVLSGSGPVVLASPVDVPVGTEVEEGADVV
jgi:hypothetical protein